MDAVELGYPVDVSRLMGSEGFGGARVTVNEVEAVAAAGAAAAAATACESSSRVSLLVNSCTTFLRQKDVTSTVNDSESDSRNKNPEAKHLKHEIQMISIQAEDMSEQVQSRGSNTSTSRSEVVQVARKVGKTSRSTCVGSKRPRLAQPEDNMSSAGVDDVKDVSDGVGPCPTKCSSIEKSQMVKQKNNCSGRRADKRNFKVPMKSKYDTFSMKAGLDLDELSLKDLLDGSYECPSLNKDKGKKAANKNENFLHSVRKACSTLPLSKPVQSPNFAEVDSNCGKKLLMSPPSSVSLVSSGVSSDQRDSCTTNPSSCDKVGQNPSSCDKESISKPGTPVNPLDFPLYQPKDTFERLALPPPKDLEALLLEATKPSASSRTNSDVRPGKQISRRSSLPPFSWSHSFNGHCRSNSDAVKLLTSRSTCQGRWTCIESSAISHGTLTDRYTNLELLSYDQSLVPPSTSVSIRWHEWSSSLESSKASLVNLASGVGLKDQVNADCPRVLAAAQTLCDMASQSSRRNPIGSTKWSKKPSQISRKARKSKTFEKPEELSTPEPMSSVAADNPLSGGVNHIIIPSKRPKLSTSENKKNLCHINGIRKGSLNWSTPKSSRSSPNRSVRDLVAETRHSATNTLRQSCMMPPPAPSRVPDKAFDSQQRQRKIIPRDWDNKGRGRLE